jgi:hypothetical protein
MNSNGEALSVILRMTPSQRTHVYDRCMAKLPPHYLNRIASLFQMAERIWTMKRNMNGGKPYEGENLDD